LASDPCTAPSHRPTGGQWADPVREVTGEGESYGVNQVLGRYTRLFRAVLTSRLPSGSSVAFQSFLRRAASPVLMPARSRRTVPSSCWTYRDERDFPDSPPTLPYNVRTQPIICALVSDLTGTDPGREQTC
jgi:hypothetical protein